MKRIKIISKEELDAEQTAHLRGIVDADKETVLFQDWELPSKSPFLLVVCCKKTDKPIGLIYRGITSRSASVAWWLEPNVRGKKFGSEMVCLLADRLTSEGATSVLPLPILPYQGKYNVASDRLIRKLKECLSNKQREKTNS